jgi:hypothetical protein
MESSSIVQHHALQDFTTLLLEYVLTHVSSTEHLLTELQVIISPDLQRQPKPQKSIGKVMVAVLVLALVRQQSSGSTNQPYLLHQS